MSKPPGSAASVLVVEDSLDISEMLKEHLTRWGYQPECAGSVVEALQMMHRRTPQLVLLDWGLPGGRSGIDLLKKIRGSRDWAHIPVLMLTARAQVDDRIYGLDAGSDDYLAKPYSMRELRSRIQALLRRSRRPVDAAAGGEPEVDEGDPVRQGIFTLNPADRTLQIGGENPVSIGGPEVLIMTALLNNLGRTVQRQKLAARMRQRGLEFNECNLNVYVSRLRKALGARARQLVTVRNSGYRLDP
ncbi:MAG: response regulator transcription factor [Gammaproteobacteria bacterium AqS3]|nr:response regulator transcription factor [Gammaproteobacteria bacterium AqS3]